MKRRSNNRGTEQFLIWLKARKHTLYKRDNHTYCANQGSYATRFDSFFLIVKEKSHWHSSHAGTEPLPRKFGESQLFGTVSQKG